MTFYILQHPCFWHMLYLQRSMNGQCYNNKNNVSSAIRFARTFLNYMTSLVDRLVWWEEIMNSQVYKINRDQINYSSSFESTEIHCWKDGVVVSMFLDQRLNIALFEDGRRYCSSAE